MAGSPPVRAQRHRWAWRVGTVAGIPIHIHFTLLLLLLWFVWIALRSGIPVVGQLLFVAGLFISVLLHEIGHALVARRFGIRAMEIILYPFGGVSRLSSMGQPHHELWISLAGPAVNVAIGMIILAGLQMRDAWIPIVELPQQRPDILQTLAIANIILAGFNLIPAFPLDGGRVVRALLARRLGMVRATAVAASIGQAFAILMGLAALLMGQFILMFIAFFVFISAGQELLTQRTIEIMRGQKVTDAMVTRFEVLAHSDTLSQAADLLLATHQEDFPVIAGEEIIGILARPDLVRGLANHGPQAYVAGSAKRDFVRLLPADRLRDALERMQAASQGVALVFSDEGAVTRERMVGMLTEENVKEFLQVQEAAPRQDRPRPPGRPPEP